jgi:hypothetical protein
MSLERTIRGSVIVLLVLLTLEGVSWMAAPVPPCLIKTTHQEQAAYHYIEKDCPTFFSGSLILFGRIDHFIDMHDKSIVAVFTVVLAISTIGLWLATNGLYRPANNKWN